MLPVRETYNRKVLGQALYDKVSASKILLVGAGGIGCELLKNLVMSGFKQIHVIDLDTIDISNLNRQFLFQRQHVKKSKAHVAKESAYKFNPDVQITSLQANIKDPQFNVPWFRQFTMVLNALDNLDARRHVNAMCLAANIPLVESGTQGYLGQAYVIQKDITECFDCQPKPTPTTYPVCTIRSTPSAPIHCIVWAKSYLFNQLFGNSEEEEESVMQQEEDEENAQELAALTKEAAELKAIKEAAGSPDYADKVLDKVYRVDIQRLLSMESMWKNRTKPVPLEHNSIASSELSSLSDQTVWSTSQNISMFKESATRLARRWLVGREQRPDFTLAFDKDDEDAMDFVTAASNLRAHVFHIPTKSLFDVKSMAGNIIPAIATTNAVIAGFVIMKAFGILRGDIKSITRTYLTTGSRFVQEASAEPNPHCSVCRSQSSVVLVDFENTTLEDLMDQVICESSQGAGMDKEEVAIMDGNRMLYDIEYEDNLQLPLKQLGLTSGSILRITQDDDRDVDLILEPLVRDQPDIKVKLIQPIPKLSTASLKRKLDEEEEEGSFKKAKATHAVVDNVVVLDDDEEVMVIS
ncbi:Ubiquitin-activating enzyme E1-like protein [Choanephora cucurbitarum]|uniref:Ubiquitin-activating enzyme E1-like n=1 Tax=Choanephora cucurbitarum TaxID=101091 RepID=A0A1C7N9J1_9FUNG|nr:Ubiquitin-activating enzyme E1-like protein [Choanephora cucurbitarum]